MKNMGDFYLKIFSFLEVKFSIYLNRRVFVMIEKDFNAESATTTSADNIFISFFLLWGI